MLLSNLLRPYAGTPAPTDSFWYGEPYRDAGSGYMIPTSPETAMRNSAVMACVKLLSEDVAKLPLIVYQRQPDGGKQRATGNPLYGILHTSPNGWQTSQEFRQLLQAWVELRGNGYGIIKAGPRGFVDTLEPVHPDLVRVSRAPGNGQIIYEVSSALAEKPRRYSQGEIFHLRGFSLDGLTGMSTLGSQRDAVALGILAQAFQAAAFRNGVKLSGTFQHPNKLGDKAFEHLQRSIREDYQGASNAGGFMILEEGMKWQEMQMTFVDAQFLELRKLNQVEICGMFRVPPHKIGNLDRATFTNIEHQSLEYVIDGLMARLVRWEQCITRDLILAKSLYFAEFLVDGLLRGDLKARYDAYAVGINAGILCANEARAFENMNAVPGGEKFRIPLNMATVSEAQRAQYGAMVHSAAMRLANKELVALRKASARFEGDDLKAWIEDFYESYQDSIAETFQLPREKARRFAQSGKWALADAPSISALILEWEGNRAEQLSEMAMAA